MITENYLLTLLLVANAVLLAAAAIAVTRFRQQCRKMERFWNSPVGAAFSDRSDESGRRQLVVNMRLEKHLAGLQRKIDSLVSEPQPPPVPAERRAPIENALRMARGGASVEDLTRSCGLNLGEARLMKKLHGAGNPVHRT